MRVEVAAGMGPQTAKEMVWLAWQSCGNPMGMGFMQDNPTATREDVWKCAVMAGDYENAEFMQSKPMSVRADYVFGRMMKLDFKYEADAVIIPDRPIALDYQAWGVKYPGFDALAKAAIESLTAAA